MFRSIALATVCFAARVIAADTPPDTLAPLLEGLKSQKAEIRIAAADALRKLGPQAKPASTALCRAVVDHAGNTRAACLDALKAVAPDLSIHVEAILYERGVAAAFNALELMGSDAAPTLPILFAYHQQLRVKNWEDGELALLRALRAIAPKDPKTRLAFLATLRPVTQVEDRRPVVRRPSFQARSFALTGLVQLAEANPDQVAKTVKELRSQLADPSLTIQAMQLLPRLGVEAKAALPDLWKLRSSSIREIRDAATAAIEKIEGTDGLAKPAGPSKP